MLKSNIDYFNLMKEYPEQIIDEYYSNLNNIVIIPSKKEDVNILTKSTDDLYRFIDTFETLSKELKDSKGGDLIDTLLKKIDNILLSIDGINYTSFCQYFMVQNISHSIYSTIEENERLAVLKSLIQSYIENRHHIYKAHGYSYVVLQTMSDNYSHKRKGKAGIIKIECQLKEIGLTNKIDDIAKDDILDSYFIEPDKGGKKVFEALLKKHNISFLFRKTKQGKLPDIMLKVKGEYYIIEHKSMKESGGGQDKQIAEVLDFIRYTEQNIHFHYITYLDGIFSNKFLGHTKAKNEVQYTEIQSVLQDNPQNYFVNTHTFQELLKDVFY